jgi:hypothetical protein
VLGFNCTGIRTDRLSGAQSDRFTKPPSHEATNSLGCRPDARAPCRGQGWPSATAVTAQLADRMGLLCCSHKQQEPKEDSRWHRPIEMGTVEPRVEPAHEVEVPVSQPCRIESVLTNLEIVISGMAMLLRPPTKLSISALASGWWSRRGDTAEILPVILDSALPVSRRPIRRLELQSQQSLGYLK